jgi:hypothetical protein
MQTETRKIHVLGSLRPVQQGEDTRDLICMPGIHTSPMVAFVEPSQTSMSNPTDHYGSIMIV